MDYRKFLDKTETMVLPYLGGLSVHAGDRRLRLTQRPQSPGWYSFEIKGRNATPKGESEGEAPDMGRLNRLVGHLVGPWLFTSGTEASRLHLMPEEEPLACSRATGRRWPSGDVLFEGFEFDDEPEEAARSALEERETLGEQKGSTPSLRAAFGYALLTKHLTDINLAISPREVLGRVHLLTSGELTAQALVDEVEARRYQIQPDSLHRRVQEIQHRARRERDNPTIENAEERAASVLDSAGADLLTSRFLGNRNLEVVFRFRDERFAAIVDWESLHVYDSGICLDGEDEQLGLDSLPSVIAEAIDTRQLHITRRY